MENWLLKHEKHLLILTSAGKPVFSYHEDFGSSGLALCALLRALAVKTQDQIECVTGANGLTLVFLRRDDLLLVGCSHGKEMKQEDILFIRTKLELLYLHVLFHVTKSALDSLFSKQPSYDLAPLLGGTEVEMRNLVDSCDVELSAIFNAIPVLQLPVETRLQLLDGLDEARNDLAPFALLIGRDGSLIAGLGPRSTKKSRFGNLFTNSYDYLLLSNFVRGTPQLSALGMETWTPICLPMYNNTGHFHTYCSSVRDGLFMLLLTTDPSLEKFHEASQRKSVFVEKMKDQLDIVLNRLNNTNLLPEDFDGKGAYHICIRAMKDDSIQFIESKKSPPHYPLDIRSQRDYLVSRYASLRYSIDRNPVRLVWDAKTRDALIFYREADLEIIGLFPPLQSQTSACVVLNKIKTFVLKNRPQLFCFPTSF